MPKRKGFPRGTRAIKRLPDLLPEEIAERAAEIRAEWDEETERSRRTGRFNKRIEMSIPGEEKYAIPITHTLCHGLTNLRLLEVEGAIEKSQDQFGVRARQAKKKAEELRRLEEDDE